MRRWARVGGLKDESRMYRCFGGLDAGWGMEWRMRKGGEEDVNVWRAVV